MGKPIPYACRVKIVRDRQSGKSYNQIALELGYSLSGVKKIWHQFQTHGEAGLALNYHKCGRRSPYSEKIHELIDSIKDGDQGAPFIRSVLEYQNPDLPIPHERTIQRWWKSQGANRPKVIRERPKADWTKEVHHTWQIDGKEQVSLSSGQQVSWINVADEASSSDLKAIVFPPKGDGQYSCIFGGTTSQ